MIDRWLIFVKLQMAFATIMAFVIPFVTSFTTHYAATHIYAAMCAPLSLWGILQSAVLTGSPICSAILGVINHTHNAYGAIILGISGVIIRCIATAPAGG